MPKQHIKLIERYNKTTEVYSYTFEFTLKAINKASEIPVLDALLQEAMSAPKTAAVSLQVAALLAEANLEDIEIIKEDIE